MLTTGDLAQMVGALMNDVTMKLMQGFDSYWFFVLFCFDFVCLFVSLFVCLLLMLGFCFFVFVFVFVFCCFFWRFPFRYRSLSLCRDRFFNLNHGLIICFSFLLLMDSLRIM